ncbi:hypothetical protein EXIGLDRAFT_721682 [Exidia glandulosa HHB12029]|uniref:F-box domain-containing protein n=1 Tax=Exidia glandulosa HHB12029 TaxID=1314781 RepID=A0A165QCV1_EXIGL|nr:hypothetical protein EXIGLDRAFT_721682 [Exidia glandulosa HHB12029]
MVAFRQLLCWKASPLMDRAADQPSAAARLPSDVLCAIFVLLDFGDRIRTTHICLHWRVVSIAHPGLLWSSIHTHGRRRGAFRRQLERAKDVPVHVVITLRRRGWGNTIAEFDRSFLALRDHMAHVKTLRIFLFTPVSRHVHGVVQALRVVPAPVLLRLDINLLDVGPLSHWQPTALPLITDDFLAREAPCLTHLELYGARFRHAVPSAFRNVEALHVWLYHDDLRSVVISSLSTMSGLRDLYLGGQCKPSALPPTLAWTIPLRNLHLEVFTFLPWMLPYFDAPMVQNLWVRTYATTIDDAFPAEDPRLNVRAHLHQSRSSRIVDIMRSDGNYRCIKFLAALNVPVSFLEYLSDVIIDEEYLTHRSGDFSTLSLPRVLQLTIVLMDDWDESITALYDTDSLLHCTSHTSCSTVFCPSLEVLNIRAAAATNLGSSDRKPHFLGAGEILALLRHVDHITTLDRLTVSGAEIVTHVSTSVSQLFDAADVVLVDPADTETTKLEGVPQPIFAGPF